ncbi:MAG TPA: hypothetical protein VMP01_22215 [Pirellulaceae bacterium]|nr:hypothetical protein [Pirellulaceae bacterium]
MKKSSSDYRPSMLDAGLYYDEPPPPDLPRDRGLTWAILGVIFLASTGILWRELSRMENSGGAIRITWMVVEAYEWGGKWVPCGISLMCGIGFLTFGLMEWLTCKKYDEPPPPKMGDRAP